LLALERARAEPQVAQACPLTDVADFVRERVATAAHLAVQRNIEIEFDAAPDAGGALPLHLESMASAVDNLISNAIKYSPTDGRITVRLTRAASGYRLAICDGGPGIAPDLRDKVFERFYRVPGQEQLGSGLGLAIAERGAARNGGTISLENGEHGRGVCATITFTGAVG
jgi:two-component system OmpR family sensor kinase